MKNINILYIIWIIALFGCYWLIKSITGQSDVTFFGTAENESIVLNFDHTVMVQKVKVKTGQMVKKGDTLAIFSRIELEHRATETNNEMNQLRLENKVKQNEIIKDLDVLETKKNALQKEIENEIRVLNVEANVQNELRKLLSNEQTEKTSVISNEKIAALKINLEQIEQQIRSQKLSLSARLNSDNQIVSEKLKHSKHTLDIIETERKQLILLSPMDGFVVEVFITENTVEPQLKPLIKINPTRTNRVKGFIYENADVAYNLGDTVALASAARPQVKAKGYFISVSPEMVELPIRLRKNPELRAWGREVYVQLPPDNQFFIGEKIMMILKR